METFESIKSLMDISEEEFIRGIDIKIKKNNAFKITNEWVEEYFLDIKKVQNLSEEAFSKAKEYLVKNGGEFFLGKIEVDFKEDLLSKIGALTIKGKESSFLSASLGYFILEIILKKAQEKLKKEIPEIGEKYFIRPFTFPIKEEINFKNLDITIIPLSEDIPEDNVKELVQYFLFKASKEILDEEETGWKILKYSAPDLEQKENEQKIKEYSGYSGEKYLEIFTKSQGKGYLAPFSFYEEIIKDLFLPIKRNVKTKKTVDDEILLHNKFILPNGTEREQTLKKYSNSRLYYHHKIIFDLCFANIKYYHEEDGYTYAFIDINDVLKHLGKGYQSHKSRLIKRIEEFEQASISIVYQLREGYKLLKEIESVYLLIRDFTLWSLKDFEEYYKVVKTERDKKIVEDIFQEFNHLGKEDKDILILAFRSDLFKALLRASKIPYGKYKQIFLPVPQQKFSPIFQAFISYIMNSNNVKKFNIEKTLRNLFINEKQIEGKIRKYKHMIKQDIKEWIKDKELQNVLRLRLEEDYVIIKD